MDPTEPLRELAPNWSLAGDKQLLDVLQNIHQRIISKCEESNVQLEAMVAELDDADIRLRNVNNKFMALSNKQFVESRVYDDDVDLHPATEDSNKESEIAAESESELSRLRRALVALEAAHEEVRILRDSDTDSDSDSDSDQHADRLVLRVREVYAHRPLPHRIGSRAFADNWHAGLLVEDSDSDSSVSKRDVEEQFSETEEEDVVEETVAAGGRDTPGDEREEPPPPTGRAAPPCAAEVAAELARRLAPTVDIDVPIPVPEYEPPARASQRVYRPHLPPTSTVFPDEPPPLGESSDESDGDIFAQLHKNKPYDQRREEDERRDPVADLFQGFKDNDEEFRIKPPPLDAQQRPPLSEQQEDPELTVHKTDAPNLSNYGTNNVKKPIGGISLFGNTSGAESIGAAILRRNQKISTSVDEIDDEVPIKKDTNTAEKNILDDIFAKPEKPQKSIPKKQKEVERKKDDLPKKNKIDLFSDNLFDDIDDIFTNNIVTKPPAPKPAVKTSIFDDDLFADVGVKETVEKVKPKLDKGLFDSDDDLFNEQLDDKTQKYLTKTVNKADNASVSKLIDTLSTGASNTIVERNTVVLEKNANLDIKAKSIFDSDEEIFLGNTKEKLKNEKIENKPKEIYESNDDLFSGNVDKVVDKAVDKKVSDNLSKLDSTRTSEKDFDENIARSTSLLEEKTFTKTLRFESDNEILNKNKTVVVPEDNSINKKAQIGTNYNKPANQHFSEATDSKKIEDNFDKTIITDDKVESHTFIKRNIDKFPKENRTLFEDNDDDIFSHSNASIKSGIDISKEVQKQIEPVETHKEKAYLKHQETTHNEIISSNENQIIKSMEPNVSQSISSPALFTDEDDNSMETPTFIRQSKTESNVLRTTKIISDHERIDTEIKIIENKPKNVLNNIEVKTVINSPSLFNDDEFEENLFKKTIDSQSQNKSDVQKFNSEFKTDTDNNYDLDANKNIKKNENLFTKTENLDSNDIFSDVFTDQPPDFEKPKEHKRSQNVNALFDDDSDDESLFFRKTDPTLDELPKDLADNTNQNMFGLFHDEPPAIDVETITKTVDITKTIQHLDSDQTTSVKAVDMDSLDEYNQNKNSKKPVGKLKPLNLNINVNTLLPGASPKKQKPSEQIDGQISSSNLIHDLQNLDEKLDNAGSNKIASFNNKVVSGVLNNKISKERAKIQIKRRPSTRRARKEAARKSGIDFGEDSTDRSSPIDVSHRKSELIKSEEPLSITTYSLNENLPTSHIINNEPDSVQDSHNPNTKPLFEGTEKTINKERECEDHIEHVKHIDILAQEKIGQKSMTSKTVYILNDEDIFSDAKVVSSIPEQEVGNSSNTENNIGITTLGSVYKEKNYMADSEDGDDLFNRSNDPKANVTLKEPKKSLFDDLSDDESELFGGKKRIETKNNIVVDSGEELFGKSKMDKKKSIVKETKVTRSLFGDDEDDDDDLFAAKPKKSVGTPSKPIEKDNTIKQNETEAVFVDPLSQLIDEE